MTKTLIIAEKPSVARDIAAALGGCRQAGSWLEGEQFVVSSGIGHLVQIADPDPGQPAGGFGGLPRIPDRVLPDDGRCRARVLDARGRRLYRWSP